MKLTDAAERIGAHLSRIAADPKLNPSRKEHGGTRAYFCPAAYARGSRVMVQYSNYQITSGLTKAEALAYLAWLDAGNVGTHYDAKRAAEGNADE